MVRPARLFLIMDGHGLQDQNSSSLILRDVR